MSYERSARQIRWRGFEEPGGKSTGSDGGHSEILAFYKDTREDGGRIRDLNRGSHHIKHMWSNRRPQSVSVNAPESFRSLSHNSPISLIFFSTTVDRICCICLENHIIFIIFLSISFLFLFCQKKIANYVYHVRRYNINDYWMLQSASFTLILPLWCFIFSELFDQLEALPISVPAIPIDCYRIWFIFPHRFFF